MALTKTIKPRRSDSPTCNSPTGVLSALSDPDSRAILEATALRSRSVPEIVDACGIPTATAYRKVDALTEVGLLDEHIRIRSSGKNISKYALRAEEIIVTIDGRDGLTCDCKITPSRDPFEDLESTDHVVISAPDLENPLAEPPP
ncbi:MAG: helix-turn-helix domain-containing protein [Natronomonas sp.]